VLCVCIGERDKLASRFIEQQQQQQQQLAQTKTTLLANNKPQNWPRW